MNENEEILNTSNDSNENPTNLEEKEEKNHLTPLQKRRIIKAIVFGFLTIILFAYSAFIFIPRNLKQRCR